MQKKNIVLKCCICQRVKRDNKPWDYHFIPLETDEISNGYCPNCYQKALQELESDTRDFSRN